MFNYCATFSGFSVNSIADAKDFYGNKLGIKFEESMGLLLLLDSGDRVFVYEKLDHEPATFTVLNFEVDSVDTTINQLAANGVTFEQYEGVTDEKGIMRNNGPTIAWFKDPSGNILSILES